MDFSLIVQDPTVRQIVQENLLERAFHDALFPFQLFRSEAEPVKWPEHSGDSYIFTAPGLITPNMRPLQPGVDPTPKTYALEQWEATQQQYADTIDTHMPTSMVAIVDLFMRNAHQLGMQAAQSLDLIVRDRMYNAAESGWTVNTATSSASTELQVARLNGFTRARRPSVSGASTVRFATVSPTNPLPITIEGVGTNTVVGYTPDTAGDEIGPGRLILGTAETVPALRTAVYADDATQIVRVGGGNSVDSVGSADTLNLAAFRAAVAIFWQNNVPTHDDKRFHCQLDPESVSQAFSDPEFQRLNTSLPDYVMYRDFAIGEVLNTIFLRNSQCPVPTTVVGGTTATFSQDDPFAPELYNNGTSTGVKLHRPLFSGKGGIFEYYSDLNALITEAGVTGKVQNDPRITNNGITVSADRVQMIIRAPLNRTQDMVSTSWKFIGDWPVRTDAATGSSARYKRFCSIIHG